MKEALIAIPEFALDVEHMVAAALKKWPGASVHTDRLGNVSVAHQASPTQWLEVSFQPTGHGIGLDGEGAELAAETIVWLMQTAHMPAEAEAVLIEWASDLIPLDLTTTRESLLAVNENW